MSSCKTLTCVTVEEIKPTKPFFHLCLSDLPASPLQDNKQCGVYSGFEGHWQSLSCESALPYICKKTPNDTRGAEPLGENMLTHRRHKHTGDLSASLEVSYTKQAVLCPHMSEPPKSSLFDLHDQCMLVKVRPAAVQLDSGTLCMTLSMPQHGSQMFPQP